MIPQAYFDKIKNHLNGDAEKAWKWFTTPNQGITCGGIFSPLDLVRLGRAELVKKAIDDIINYKRGIS